MRITPWLAALAVVPFVAGCANGGGGFLGCIPILCSFVGEPPAPAPPPPPPPPPPRAAPAPPPPGPDPCAGRIVLRGVTFAFDRAELTGASQATLDVAAEQLSRCPNIRLRVEGHTDSMGGDAYNQSLSQRRAETVRSYLSQRGVGGGRLEAHGMGESQPVATNDTAEGRSLNRRVELTPVR